MVLPDHLSKHAPYAGSQNTALIDLYCGYNQLTSLDVSQNTDLEYLDCTTCQLTSLDVTQNMQLEYTIDYNMLSQV